MSFNPNRPPKLSLVLLGGYAPVDERRAGPLGLQAPQGDWLLWEPRGFSHCEGAFNIAAIADGHVELAMRCQLLAVADGLGHWYVLH